MQNGGWDRSAEAWVAFMEEGDPNRTHLLDPVMLALCGEVRGKRVLDIGCGEGRFVRMLKSHGARVVGIDSTSALIRHARSRDKASTLGRGSAEALPFLAGIFDLAVSYVSLVDIAGYREAIDEAARVLKSGGRFVASNVSAFTTAEGRWIKNAEGEKLCYAFDRYAEEFAVRCGWRGIDVLQYHRPMGSILTACLDAGLRLEHFSEPAPNKEAVAERPVLGDFNRMPNFYAMAWVKE